MDGRKQIGERLRWVLLDRYGTLYNASRKLDNQLRTMQRWFTGESMPSGHARVQASRIPSWDTAVRAIHA